jgi:hypothetical protein
MRSELGSDRILPPTAGASDASLASPAKRTRALLACGVVAGPLYVVVGLVQALTRSGFDREIYYLMRQPTTLPERRLTLREASRGRLLCHPGV